MDRWDIQPAGVRGVVTRTQGVAAEFEGQLRTLHSALEGAAGQSSSEIIASAVAEFAKARKADIDFVFARTGAAINAAAQATTEYLNGDLEMAANAQASATAAPDPRATMPGGVPR